MAVQQTIPNFEFSGFYYFEILADILRFLRVTVPEITDESEEEGFIQLARAWALAHHFTNVRIDIIANETLLPTARLLESVRSQLRLIDFILKQATPASAQMVMQFSALFTDLSTLIVPRNSQLATEDTEETEQIVYEAIEDNSISRTDQLSHVFINLSTLITLSNQSGNLYDFVSTIPPAEGDIIFQNGNYAIVAELIDVDTLRLNDATAIINGAARLDAVNFGGDRAGEAATDSLTFDFGVTDPEVLDIIYFIHDSVMWDRLDFVIDQVYKTGIRGVWEFFDGTGEDENPDEVTNLGSNLEFDLTRLLGTDNKEGTAIQLTFAPTVAGERVISKFVGGKNIARSTGLLGQITPSLIETDYLVGTVWQPLSISTNTENDEGEFSTDGILSYVLPQDLKQNWAKTTINGKEGFPLRFRVQELEKKAATFLGTGFNAAGLDTNNFNIKVGFDAFADTELDVTGDGGTNPGTYTLASVVSRINTVMAGVSASLANVASAENGQLRLASPDPTLGKNSSLRFVAPAANDATNEVTGLSETGYPFTFIGVGGITVIDRAKIDVGAQFLLFSVVQGESTAEDPLASSDGSPNQKFILGQTPLVDGTLVIEVDEGSGFTQYDEVENFLNSDGAAKVFRKEITADDVTTVFFGDGETGKIPPPGVDNIKASYRIGADQDGNVGARTIIVNLAGISNVSQVFNPRPAAGFAIKAGSDEESLALAKIEGPASLRTLGKAITTPDIETLGESFISPTTGSSPISRSKAIEETFGVKTVELLVVGVGGNILNLTQREEVQDFFNGNKGKKIDGILVTNHEVTLVNFTPRVIDVEVLVDGGNIESIKNALTALINPEAKFDDNITFRWDFGSKVPTSIIIAEVHDTDPINVKEVDLIQPAADVILGDRELPVIGNIIVTLV